MHGADDHLRWETLKAWLDYQSLWTRLRGLGNSKIAKATSLIPIAGSFLIVDYTFLEKIPFFNHLTFRSIHFLYYDSCSIAIATMLFALFCPARVKKYLGLVKYTAAEVPFFNYQSHQYYYRRLAANEYSRLSRNGRIHN